MQGATEKIRVVVTREEDSQAAWELFVHHARRSVSIERQPTDKANFCGVRSYNEKQRRSRVACFEHR